MTLARQISVLILLSQLLAGCGNVDKFTQDFFGQSRSVPEGSAVKFGERHMPILNPGSTGNGVTPEQLRNPINTSTNISNVSAPASKRKVPVENLNAVSSNNVNSSNSPVSAPVMPVSSSAISKSEYPSLANVPPTPIAPPKASTVAEFKSMSDQRASMEVSRKELMDNPDAAVLTSPKPTLPVTTATNTTVASKPLINPFVDKKSDISAHDSPVNTAQKETKLIQPTSVTNNQISVVKETASNNKDAKAKDAIVDNSVDNHGFNSWLHETVPPVEQASKSSQQEKASQVKAVNQGISPFTDPLPKKQTIVESNEETVVDKRLTVNNSAPVTNSAPIVLHPPKTTYHEPLPSQDVSSESVAPAQESIKLTPPSANNGSSVKYLSESRYAARRQHLATGDADQN